MTWHELLDREPRLARLEDLAIRRHGEGWPAWRAICRQLRALIGWYADNPAVQPGDAYDTAYRHLLRCWETGLRSELATPYAQTIAGLTAYSPFAGEPGIMTSR